MSNRWLSLCFAFLVGSASAPGDDPALRQQIQELRRKASEAHRAKDWPAMLEATRKARDLEPSRPGNLYNLACAEALNGHVEEAARLLNDLLDRGIDYGIEDAADLAAARESAPFAPLLKRAAAMKRPIGASTVAFRLPEKDLLTEGIAYDPSTRAFFVSSVHRRKILRRAADGEISNFVAEGQDGIGGVFALAVDHKHRLLWACSAAVPQMRGYESALDGSTALFAYDLASGRLRRKIALARDGKSHVLNDLTVDVNGDLYTSDSVGGGVFVVRSGSEKIEEFFPPGVFRSPQGLAFSKDGSWLYVADWAEGLFRISRATRQREEVLPLAGVPLLGIDGLARHGEELVVTQNLLRPHRVARLILDPRGTKVAHAVVLDQADPEFAEPTLGVVVADDFYIVGKSQWERFDEETGAVSEDKLVEPAILKVSLRPAS